MKKFLLMVLSATTLTDAAQHQLEKLWTTDTIVAIPESVLPDFKKGILYVSLIDGGGWDADGKEGWQDWVSVEKNKTATGSLAWMLQKDWACTAIICMQEKLMEL